MTEKGYTDIHAHILPGLDDGARDLDEAVEMAELAYARGIRRIIATPHFSLKWRSPSPEHVQEAFSRTAAAVRETHPDMEMYLGNELYFSQGCLEALRGGRAFTLAGSRYLLAEFSTEIEWKTLTEYARMVPLAGYRMIIAHAERYECLWAEPGRFAEAAEMGAYIQVNARTFMGGLFDAVHGRVMKLLADGLIHFVASDCHNTGQRDPIMEEAVARMRRKVAGGTVDRVLYENPEKLLADELL